MPLVARTEGNSLEIIIIHIHKTINIFLIKTHLNYKPEREH